jgi:hypothetical protein
MALHALLEHHSGRCSSIALQSQLEHHSSLWAIMALQSSLPHQSGLCARIALQSSLPHQEKFFATSARQSSVFQMPANACAGARRTNRLAHAMAMRRRRRARLVNLVAVRNVLLCLMVPSSPSCRQQRSYGPFPDRQSPRMSAKRQKLPYVDPPGANPPRVRPLLAGAAALSRIRQSELSSGD